MGKIKYLLLNTKQRRCEFILISFNEILAKVGVSLEFSLLSTYFMDKWITDDFREAYNNHDIAAMKKSIFGDMLEDEVELYLDKAVIGVRSDGMQISTCYEGGPLLTLKLDYIGADAFKGRYRNLIKKIEIAGVTPDFVIYDYGVKCQGIKRLKYIDAMDCMALDIWKEDKITDKSFGNVYIWSLGMNKVKNVSINCLIDSNISESDEIDIVVNNTIRSKLTLLNNSRVHLKNVRGLELGFIKTSNIIIDNAYDVVIRHIIDSVLRFNCDITRGTIDFWRFHPVRTKLVFVKSVDVEVLKHIIDTASKHEAYSFSIILNSTEYAKCARTLVGCRYMKFIVNGGEHIDAD